MGKTNNSVMLKKTLLVGFLIALMMVMSPKFLQSSEAYRSLLTFNQRGLLQSENVIAAARPICPACVCCAPPPQGSCCRCCPSSPVQTVSLP
ncbi:hypothetical protein LINGRAHAP2_LOCUS7521 [Linum grandiflorum]